jgi:hypothetical protein
MPPRDCREQDELRHQCRRNQKGAGSEEFYIATTEPAEPPAERAEHENRGRGGECGGRTAVRQADRNADRDQAEWSEVGDCPHRDVVQRRNAEQDNRECQQHRLQHANQRVRFIHTNLAIISAPSRRGCPCGPTNR